MKLTPGPSSGGRGLKFPRRVAKQTSLWFVPRLFADQWEPRP